jgi:Ribbon-helix-helix protein, copG family
MTKSISVKQKKRGRPATGIRPIIGLRLSETEIARVDRWAGEQKVSRSEAVRLLIERGLKK